MHKTGEGVHADQAGHGGRRRWIRPELRRMRAGQAENGFGETVDDNVFTKS